MSDRAAPQPPKKKRGVVGIVVLAVVLAVPLAAWLLRGTIATSIAEDELAARGLRCDERFAIELTAFFGEATVGPTRCVPEREGAIEAIELTAPATVELAGFSPASVRAESVRLVLRPRAIRNGTRWARPLERLRLEEKAAALVKGLAEISALELPPTELVRVEVVRAGDALARIDRLQLTPGEPMAVAIQRVLFDAAGGAAQLTLSGITGHAARAVVHLEGDASARAGISIFSVQQGGAFRLDATELDSASPRFALGGSF